MFPADRTIGRSGLSSLQQRQLQPKQRVFLPPASGELRRQAWVAAPSSSPPQRGHSHSSHTSTGKSAQCVLMLERKQAWGHEVRLCCTTGQSPLPTRGSGKVLKQLHTDSSHVLRPRGDLRALGTNRFTKPSSSNHPGPALGFPPTCSHRGSPSRQARSSSGGAAVFRLRSRLRGSPQPAPRARPAADKPGAGPGPRTQPLTSCPGSGAHRLEAAQQARGYRSLAHPEKRNSAPPGPPAAAPEFIQVRVKPVTRRPGAATEPASAVPALRSRTPASPPVFPRGR